MPLAVVDGPPAATARLREILGVGAAERPSATAGPRVAVAAAGFDLAPAAAVLAAAKRDGRRALMIVIGTADERQALERATIAHTPLELSNVVHIVSFGDAELVRRTLAAVLGSDGAAIARSHPLLRDAVADAMIAQTARQASTVGAAVIVPGADMPVITLIQVRLVAQLAAVYGRPLDVRRGLEIGGVLLSAIGWRALARRAVTSIPVAGFALRAGIAYSGTRAVGEACKAYFATMGDRADAPLDGLAKALNGALAQRKGTSH
jgi:uncharacterized protein (DUF697 family)